jgi:hypothetical protein
MKLENLFKNFKDMTPEEQEDFVRRYRLNRVNDLVKNFASLKGRVKKKSTEKKPSIKKESLSPELLAGLKKAGISMKALSGFKT